MLTLLLSALAGVSAAVTIYAKYRLSARSVLVAKLVTMAFIIAIALVDRNYASSRYQALVVLGLLASAVGDTLLALPGDRLLAGMLSFLVAHIFYIVAFTTEAPHAAALWYIIPFVLYGVLFLWWMRAHLGTMRIPVIIYTSVILIMAWQAANRWIVTDQEGALLALVGAYLFVMSDSALAVERFRGSWRSAPFWVLSTYFVAQWLIALSV